MTMPCKYIIVIGGKPPQIGGKKYLVACVGFLSAYFNENLETKMCLLLVGLLHSIKSKKIVKLVTHVDERLQYYVQIHKGLADVLSALFSVM